MTWPVRSIEETLAILTAPGAPFAMEEVVALGRRVRSYSSLPVSLRALFDASRAFGERDFIVYQGERLNYEAHWRAATAFGHELARLGVGKGDRVAVAMRNYPEWSICAWGTLATGAVLVPLNAWEPGVTLVDLLADAGAKVAVVDAERLQRITAVGGTPATLIVAKGDRTSPASSLDDLIGPPERYRKLPDEPLADPGLVPDDLATIFYTSGTTGRSKGAFGTHRNVLTNLVNTGFRAARAAVRRGEPVSPPTGMPRSNLLPLPLFHVTGFHSMLVPTLSAGGTVHLMYKWDVDHALDLVERERINGLTLVPTMAWELADALERRTTDVSSVDSVGYGGAAAAPELAAKMRALFPNAFPGQGYGATETSSLVAANSHEDIMARPGSVGIAVPCCDVRIVDENGNDLPDGQPGELWVSGPNVVAGYWNQPDATRESFADGWYRTGDIAERDSEGFICIRDRIKDMLIRGGENIYCAEIEDCLMSHPQVVEAAVFGVPHPVLGEVVGAVVRLRSPASPAELIDHVRARLATHKAPERIELAHEPLPRNAAGKLLKREIRGRYANLGDEDGGD